MLATGRDCENKHTFLAKMCSTRPSKVLVIRPRNVTTDRSDGDSSSSDLPFEIIEEINGNHELYSYREVG